MSRPPNRNLGEINLVGSMGRPRTATYRQVYLFNPFVYAATNLISRGVGRMPVHVYGLSDAEGNKQRFRSDIPQTPGRPSAGVQLDRLLNQPGQRISRMAMFVGTLRERIIYGNGLWEIVGGDLGLPTSLRRISWRNVDEVNEDGYGNVNYYKISPRGEIGSQRILYPDQVVHFGMGTEADQACGISLLESCKHTLALHDAVMRHLLAYLENSARGSGHFRVENNKQAEQARQMITELYTSPENAGKVLVTNAEWQSMSDTPQHAELVALIKESRTEIAAAFQVPPPVLGLLEQAIRANVKEMREQFVRDTTGPWASDLEGDIQTQLIQPFQPWSSLFAEFDMNSQLRPDLEARALVYQRLMFVFSIDEIRTMENKPPLGLAGVSDVPWAPSGSMPLPTAAGKSGTRIPTTDPGDTGDTGGDVVGLSLPDARRLVSMLDELEQDLRAKTNGHLEPIGAP